MKKLVLRILPLIILIAIALLGVSYAMFSSALKLGLSEVTTGTIDVLFNENKNTLKLEKALPEYDNEGKVSENYLDFTVDVKVAGNFRVTYVVTAEKDSNLSNIDDRYIKLYLERSTDGVNYQEVMAPTTYEAVTTSTTGVKQGSMIIDTGVLTQTTKYYYRLRMWLDGSYSDNSTSKSYTLTTNAYLTTEEENVDTAKPVCTFNNPTINLSKTSEVELTCTDNTIGVNDTTLTLNDIEIDNDNIELLSINKEKVNNGYKYKIGVRGLNVGKTNISLASEKITDKLGNAIDSTTRELTIDGLTYNVVYRKDANIKSLEKDNDSCTTTGNNTSCSITLPAVEVEDGYVLLGYYIDNTKINTSTIEIDSDKEIEVRSESSVYTVEYDYAENGGDSISEDTTNSTNTTKVMAESINASKTVTKSAYVEKTAVKNMDAKKSMFKSVAYNKEVDLTPTAERTGYEFVGWNTDKDAKKGLKSLKMSKGNIVLYAIYKRDVTTTFEVQDPEAVTIESKDVVCTMYNKDSDCSITSPTLTAKTGYTALGWNTSSDATTSELKGNITTKVTDNSKYYSITKNNTKYTATFTVQDYNAASKSGGTTTCYKYNGTKSCRVTAPKLTAKNGYKIAGWNRTKGAKKSETDSETYIDITENTTFYSVTYKPLTATFTIQDSNATTTSSTKVSCDLYNGNSEGCEIDVPSLIANEGYTAIGWNTDKSKKENSLDSDKIYINKNTTYYSMTHENTEYTATFVVQDSLAAVADYDTASCFRYNGSKSCTVKAPALTANEGYTMVGWNTSKTATSSTLESDKLSSITANTTYYSITYDNKVYTASFVIQDSNAVKQELFESKTCKKYNGAESCSLTFPTMTANTGYTAAGWDKNKDETSYSVANGKVGEITEDTTFYSVTYKTLTATFTLQDGKSVAKIITGGKSKCRVYNGLTVCDITTSCYEYNGTTSCDITTPKLEANEGYTVIGWNSEKNKKTSNLDQGITLTLTENVQYYSVTRDETHMVAYWNANGSTLEYTNGRYCLKYNGETGCIVTPPKVTPSENTPEFLGYTLGVKEYTISYYNLTTNTLTVNKSNNGKIWYAQTYNPVELKATFAIGPYVESISKTEDSCYRRNGSDECTVILPKIVQKEESKAGSWYVNGAKVTTGAMKENTLFTAIAPPPTYSITYNLNSGTCSKCAATYTIENAYTLPTPIRPGYEFLGWIGSNGTTPEKTVTISKGTKGDKEYTANWSPRLQIVSGDKNTVGSIAQIADEQFYVIGQGTGSEAGMIKLFKKRGLMDSNKKEILVSFADTNYWSNRGYDYHVVQPYVYDSNNNSYSAIEEYIVKLKNLGVTSPKGRLISYEEAKAISQEIKKQPNWEAYWTGTVQDNNYAWQIFNSGKEYVKPYKDVLGIRPVILVPTSSIN